MAEKPDISKNAVVYARYSSNNQTEQSIEGQLAAAHKYADTKGYTIIHEYIDRAKTGRNDNRDDFQKMLSDTAKKQFSIIIVWKVDRFGRNREEVILNKMRCKKNGVHVEYVAELVPEGPEGVILEGVFEAMAEYYSLQLSQNVKRGLLESAKQYKAVTGGTPLGYKIGPDKHFEIDPVTAPVIKVIFERYASGESLFDLIEYLNQNGYKTRFGKPFQRSSLDRLLKNEQYIGTYTYKDIIRAEDVIPPIIEKDLFYKVQDMLKKNRREPSNKWKYSDYVLTGKMFCGKCGCTMVGKAGYGRGKKKYGYYACKGHLDGTGCDKRAIRQDFIEDGVFSELVELLNNDDLLNFIIDQTWEYYLKCDDGYTEEASLKKQLDEIEKAYSNLIKAVESGLPYDAVKPRMDELEGEKAAINKSLAEMELSRNLQLTKEHILFFFERFKDKAVDDPACKRMLIDTFINTIYVFDDKVKIAYNYTTENGQNAITLAELKKAHEHGLSEDCFECVPLSWGSCTGCETLIREPLLAWLQSVFVLSYRLQARK